MCRALPSIIFSGFCFLTYSQQLEFVQIPSINEQIELYKRAYSPFNYPPFEPQSTHIAGLIPLLKIAFSYVHQALTDPYLRSKLLLFWEEAQEACKQEQITIPYFKKANLRLAFLVAQEQKESLYTQRIPLLRQLKKNNAWQDMHAYSKEEVGSDILMACPFPLCFEAILYHVNGELEPMLFLHALINPHLTMGISAFPIHARGPHGDYVADPAAFLFHDFVHWANFANQFGKNIQEMWPVIKQMVSKMDMKDAVIRAGEFILVHEVNPDMDDIFAQPGQCEYDDQISHFFKSDTSEPTPESLIMRRWIWFAHEEIYRVANLAEGPIGIFLESIDFENASWSNPCLQSIEQLGPDLYKIRISVSIHGCSQLIYFQGLLRFEKTDKVYFEKVYLNELLGEEKVSVSPEHILLREKIAHAGQGGLIVLSRALAYDAQILDLITMINGAYGYEVLSRKSTQQQIMEKFEDFWQLFYKRFCA